MSARTPRIVVIAGPTASGKTALALDLARRVDGELIGADSVQLYRGLDLGSAKPTASELDGVTHHLLDVCDLDEPFDAGRYVTLADEAVADVVARGRAPIVVGGTGLYLRALIRGLAQGIPSDPTVRAALNERASRGPDELGLMHDELAAVDPEYAAKIHRTDPIRIVRALEVYALSGEPISAHHRRHAAEPSRYDALFIGLEVPRPVLAQRIGARVAAMLSAGLIEEVRALLAKGYAWDLKPLRSVGYAEVVSHLRGELAERDLPEAMAKSTREFAKRQRTWFRGEQGVSWRSPETLVGAPFAREVEKYLRGE